MVKQNIAEWIRKAARTADDPATVMLANATLVILDRLDRLEARATEPKKEESLVEAVDYLIDHMPKACGYSWSGDQRDMAENDTDEVAQAWCRLMDEAERKRR